MDAAQIDRHYPAPNHAEVEFRIGKSSARFELEVTPAGLVAVGFLVSSILLSVTPIVLAATRQLRQPRR